MGGDILVSGQCCSNPDGSQSCSPAYSECNNRVNGDCDCPEGETQGKMDSCCMSYEVVSCHFQGCNTSNRWVCGAPYNSPANNCKEEKCNCPVPPCSDDCPLPACTAPLQNTGDEKYKLSDFVACSKGKGCGDETGPCFEVPSSQPTSTLQILPTGTPTDRGCTSQTHTGFQVNNPIHMIGTYTDTDGANDIEAIYVWLKKGDSIPNTPKYIDFTNPATQQAGTYTKDSYGFMMHKENGKWIPYVLSHIDKKNDKDKWVRASFNNNRFAIKGLSNTNIAYVNVKSVTSSGNDVIFDFELDYRNISEANRVIDGSYNIFLMVNDVFGFTPIDNYLPAIKTDKMKEYFGEGQIRYFDKWTDSTKDWIYDFTPPSVNTISSEIFHPTTLKFSWNIDDPSELFAVVINAYTSDTVITSDSLTQVVLNSKGNKTVALLPYTLTTLSQGEALLGNLETGYLAKSTNINDVSDDESILINIGANREGSLFFYTTVFDKACNYSGSNHTYNLEDWIITNGGLTYSQGGIDFSVKNAEANLWSTVNLLKKIDPTRADITSELYGGNNPTVVLNKLVKSTTSKSYSISPFKGYKDVSFYNDLKGSFDSREMSMSNVTKINSLGSSLGAGVKVLDKTGDLTVGPFLCDGKGMFFVSGNLTINGNITNSNTNSDACIFVVKGDVVINPGSNAVGSIGYDEINAYILSDGSISINKDSNFDGLYISGGLQSRKDISMSRYLALGYRNTHPALVINHHSKYGIFTSMLVGSPVDTIKTEVGFKPY